MPRSFKMDQTVQQLESRYSCKNVFAVYAYLIAGLLVTVLTVIICCRVEFIVNFVRSHFIITMILSTLLMTATLYLFNKMSYRENKTGKLMFWIVICFLAGIPLLEADSGVLLKAAVYTTILVVILSLKSFIIPLNLINSFIYPMTVLHTVVLICTIYSILFGLVDSTFSHIVTAFCLHGGFLVYSALLICNTQRLSMSAKYARFDPIFSAVVMFMNIINLLSRVATFCSIDGTIQTC